MDVQQKINAGAYKNDVPYSHEDRAPWRKREAELMAQFWLDVAEEFGAERYPLKQWQKLCSFAWDQGHSSGLSEVLYWIAELVELIEP